MSFGSSKAPEVKDPPPAPTRDDEQVLQAENNERKRRVLMGGRASTILTKPNMNAPSTSSVKLMGQ